MIPEPQHWVASPGRLSPGYVLCCCAVWDGAGEGRLLPNNFVSKVTDNSTYLIVLFAPESFVKLE